MFINSAFAQAAGGDTGSQIQSAIQQFAPFVLVIIVFYFLLIKPQQQRAKQLKATHAGLRRGDRVVTSGGIIGTVTKIASDDEVEVAIAENVRVRVVRSTISTVLAKTEPVKNKGKPVIDEVEDDGDTVLEMPPEKKRNGNRIS